MIMLFVIFIMAGSQVVELVFLPVEFVHGSREDEAADEGNDAHDAVVPDE